MYNLWLWKSGEKKLFWKDGGKILLQSSRDMSWYFFVKSHTRPIPVIIRPGEGFIVTCLKIFIYCKIGVTELKLEHSAGLFGVFSVVKLLRS